MKLLLTILGLSFAFSSIAKGDSGLFCAELMEDESSFVLTQLLNKKRSDLLGRRYRSAGSGLATARQVPVETSEPPARGPRQSFTQFMEASSLRSPAAPLVFAHRKIDIKPVVDMILPILPKVADDKGLQQRELENGKIVHWFTSKDRQIIEIAPLAFEFMSEVMREINKDSYAMPMTTEDLQAWFLSTVEQVKTSHGHAEGNKYVYAVTGSFARFALIQELKSRRLPMAWAKNQLIRSISDKWTGHLAKVTTHFLVPEIQMHLNYVMIGLRTLKQHYFNVLEQYIALSKDSSATTYISLRDGQEKPIQFAMLMQMETGSSIRVKREFAKSSEFITHANDWIYGRTDIVDSDLTNRIVMYDLYQGAGLISERYEKFQNGRRSNGFSLPPEMIADIELVGYNSHAFFADYSLWILYVL